MMPPTPNALLDLAPGVGQVASRFRYVAHDVGGPIGEVHPVDAPTITVDTGANVVRTLSGFVLPEADRDQFDPLQVRIHPEMELSDGTRWPLGVFMYADGDRHLRSGDGHYSGTLYDLGLLLDSPMGYPWGLPPNAVLSDALRQLLELSGVHPDDIRIDHSDQVTGGPVNWTGTTLRRQIAQDISKLLGFTRVYFDNTGVARAHRPPELGRGEAHRYRPGRESRIMRDSVHERDGLVDAAGAFLVVASGPTPTPIQGYATVPYNSPLHPDHRRHTRVEVHTLQGVFDSYHAQAIAEALAARQPTDLRQIEFDSLPDPRHDAFELCEWIDGDEFRELSHRLRCQPEGPHHHRLAKGLDAAT